MPIAHLADRGVVRVAGEEAKSFLDGLLTCDLDRVAVGQSRYGGLLTPQGKILFDLIVFHGTEAEPAFYLDCLKAQAPTLAGRLGFYKLRAKVTVADRSSGYGVIGGWDGSPRPDHDVGLVADDPRLPALGWRAVVGAKRAAELGASAADAYHAHRIAFGVPEGGKDFTYGEAFPHDALMDQLHGIDFDKGCYVGQEVVSRVQHRGTARTRIVKVLYPDGAAAAPGTEIIAGERKIGQAGSGIDGTGLAMVRIDRADDALASGETIQAAGRPVKLTRPDWATFSFSGVAAATQA